MSNYAEILAPMEGRYRAELMHATFGHLNPKPNNIHKGTFTFTYTAWGKLCPINDDFEGLDASPLLFYTLEDYMATCKDKEKLEPGHVYQVDGQVRCFKNGNIRISGKLNRLL